MREPSPENRLYRIKTSLLALIASILITPPLWGVDGVIEINQARAMAGGVTASDTAGFPVTLDQAGSYRLTGNLTVPDENTTAIQVTAEGVTIDLNGFSIIGPAEQTGANGTGRGIAGSTDLVVTNGIVRGMGSSGINGGSRSRIENVHLLFNQTGLSVAAHSQIFNVNANRNRNLGMLVGSRSLVKNSVANRNGSHGIDGFPEVSYIDNIVSDNGGAGIFASDDSIIRGNHLEENASRGLLMGDGCGYGGNLINNNNGGNGNSQIALGSGASVFQLSTNICGGNTTCL